MRSKTKNAASVMFLLGIIYFLVGTVFLVTGIIVLIKHSAFIKNAVHTDALITLIETDTHRSNGKTRTDHDVWVKYEADGETFERILGYYNSGMHEGDIIEICYDPNNPTVVQTDSKILELIFILIGGVFAILGAVFLIVNTVSRNRQKMLIETGDRVVGVITDVVRNNNVRINGYHPYKAECEVVDPFSGEKYLYSSENVTIDISGLVGREVTVYVDRNNKGKYYVDIFELIDRHDSDERINDYR